MSDLDHGFFAVYLKREDNKFAVVEAKAGGRVYWFDCYKFSGKVGDIVHVFNRYNEISPTQFCMCCETLQKKWVINCSGFSKASGFKCTSCGFEWSADSSGMRYKVSGEEIQTSSGYWSTYILTASAQPNYTERKDRVLELINEQRGTRNLEPLAELKPTTYELKEKLDETK